MRAPLLAAITLHQTGGGIAVVSRLLWQVFMDRWGSHAHLVSIFDHENCPATFAEKAGFALAVTRAQLLGRTDWMMFSHLALAQTGRFVPAPARRPYGVFLHGIEAWAPLSTGARRALAAADVRIANSRYTAQRVMATHPDIGDVKVCALALPPLVGGSVTQSAPLSIALGMHVVLVVGRTVQSERYKGHDQLIEAWPAVVTRVPDAQLVIVGDGDDGQRLRERAAQSACGGNILFTGFVPGPTLDALYEQAALFALPSGGEGFGLVYLEAMTHALACIGSRHDAASEIIVDGETGRLVEQNDLDGLADAIASLLLDEPRRRAMGHAGQHRAATEFSFDRFSSRLCELLEGAREGPRSARR